ncbi:protein S100-A11-like [Ambystoma mexicanum]|uniref:EF-hand domain-containing protein n=1 Tax=Ailuropoda melanoleuca TaxID=9646 RepID=A0A7N5JH77_AILME
MAQKIQDPPTDMERCMESLITIFQRYAGKEGDNSKMSFKEFESFMNVELKSFTKSQKNPQETLKKMMASLDGGIDGKKDGQIDFQEFLSLIGGMMIACHEAMSKSRPACR